MVFIGLLLLSAIMVMGYVIFIIVENNKLMGEKSRLEKELEIVNHRYSWLVDPLESIAEQDPITALHMLRDHLQMDK